jgi:hypothetical protein
MGYLKCNKCGGYYELQPGENPSDFSNKCQCGGKLEYVENLNEGKASIKGVEDTDKQVKSESVDSKGNPWLGLAFLCCIGVIVIIVISGFIFPSHGITNTTYSDGTFTFEYPSSWTESSTNKLAFGTGNVPHSSNINCNVFVEEPVSIKEYAAGPPAIPATFDSVVQDIQATKIGNYTETNINVAGVSGMEYVEKSTDDLSNNLGGRYVAVYFAKGDNLYQVHMTSTDFDADKPGFDMIINTLQVIS